MRAVAAAVMAMGERVVVDREDAVEGQVAVAAMGWVVDLEAVRGAEARAVARAAAARALEVKVEVAPR